MEWLLIAAMFVSLALAVAMSVVAWRLLARDRERSAARIEALEAMAFEASAPVVRSEPRPDPSWDGLLQVQPKVVPAADRPGPRPPQSSLEARPLFDEAPVQHVAARRGLAMVAMVTVVAAALGAIMLIRSPTVTAALFASSDDRTAVNGKALELLSLRHAADPAGAFTVTGLVQNPGDGRDVEQIEAVLYLFDETGQLLTSARAPIDIPTLGPGDESPFVVRVPTSAAISRYRVGFRRADGRAVAHVDRRGQLPEGTSGDVIAGEGDIVTPARATRAGAVERTGVAAR